MSTEIVGGVAIEVTADLSKFRAQVAQLRREVGELEKLHATVPVQAGPQLQAKSGTALAPAPVVIQPAPVVIQPAPTIAAPAAAIAQPRGLASASAYDANDTRLVRRGLVTAAGQIGGGGAGLAASVMTAANPIVGAAVAVGVGAVATLNQVVTTLKSNHESLVRTQAEYNRELRRSAELVTLASRSGITTTSAGEAFRSDAVKYRQRAYQIADEWKEKSKDMGWSVEGEKLRNLYQLRVSEQVDEAQRRLSLAGQQEVVAATRDAELRSRSAHGLRLKGEYGTENVQLQRLALEVKGERASARVSYEDGLAAYNADADKALYDARREGKSDEEIARIERLQEGNRQARLRQFQEQDAHIVAQGRERQRQLGDQWQRDYEKSEAAHGERMLVSKSESALARLQLDNKFYAAERQGITDSFDQRKREIESRRDEELKRYSKGGKAYLAIERRASEDIAAEQQRRDDNLAALNKKHEQRTMQQVIGSELTARAAELRLARKGDQADLEEFDFQTRLERGGVEAGNLKAWDAARARQREALVGEQARSRDERMAGYGTRRAQAAAMGRGQGELAGMIGVIAGMGAELRVADAGDKGVVLRTQQAELRGMKQAMLRPSGYATEWSSRYEAAGGPGGDAGEQQVALLREINQKLGELNRKADEDKIPALK